MNFDCLRQIVVEILLEKVLLCEFFASLYEIFCKLKKYMYLCIGFEKSPDGGIGRRAGLKHQCRKASRFEPGSGYYKSLVNL